MAMGGKNERGYRIGVEEASSGFIMPTIAPSLQASQAIGDPHDQTAYVVATPLSSTAHGVRRQEDDVNIVPDLGWNWQTGGDFRPMFGEQAPALQKNQTTAVGVRRLTPVECERLQAWPDDWTDPEGTAPDSRRYAACGDGVTASVSEWIGRRLMDAS